MNLINFNILDIVYKEIPLTFLYTNFRLFWYTSHARKLTSIIIMTVLLQNIRIQRPLLELVSCPTFTTECSLVRSNTRRCTINRQCHLDTYRDLIIISRPCMSRQTTKSRKLIVYYYLLLFWYCLWLTLYYQVNITVFNIALRAYTTQLIVSKVNS